MDRRSFLKSAAGFAALASLGGGKALASEKPASAVRLTILHTTDVHSHLEPYNGLGGAAARHTLIKEFRANHPNVLLLDSGDILQGTPYFTLFDGEPEFRVMNAHGYVAATIGNHDFDAGIERLAELTELAAFPFLNANYDFSNTPMEGKTRDSMILEIEGARVGIFGLGIKLDGLVPGSLYGETRYLDPIEIGSRVARRLKYEEKCDFIILLSHINLTPMRFSDTGEPGDRDLIYRIPEIDLILSGHNHNLFRKPSRHERPEGIGFIQQTGWAGTHVGALHFDVFASDKKELAGGASVEA